MIDANYTLSNGDGNSANEARYMALLVPSTLTLTAARNVIVPATSKMYTVRNLSTGGFAVTVKTSAGAGISVPNGKTMILYCNGTDVLDGTTYFTDISVGALDVQSGDALIYSLTVGRGPGAVATNTTFGYQANNSITTSSQHTAIGYRANASMVAMGNIGAPGDGNVALGYKALEVNTGTTSITRNVAVGNAALLGSTTGTLNTAVGSNTAIAITSGTQNVAVGADAMYQAQTSASYNVAVGYQALGGNPVNNNVAVGYKALLNYLGSSLTAVGYHALTGASGSSGTTGNAGCVAVGSNALATLDSVTYGAAVQNTALGFNAGQAHQSGSNNTFIGYTAAGSTVSASNEFTLGNASIATLRCQVTSITALSDARDKTEVAPLPYGLSFVQSLNPVSFTWNTRDGAKVGIKSSGFIAQDLKAAQDAVGAAETLNLVYESNPEKLEATYGNLIPVLVKAIQELKAEFDAYKTSHP
jgi:hypothetical protein